MRRPTLLENLIENLAGNVPKWSEAFLPAPLAHQQLKAMTGRDLGDNADAWRAWLLDPDTHPEIDEDQ
ncbi:MAG: hypothetical protein U0165_15815 [Polyangiaceae bacterium]